MVNNFSVDQVGLCIYWANNSLFIILGKLPALNLPIKSHPSFRQLFFLMHSNFSVKLLWLQSYKEQAISLIPRYLIDIIHKTVKPSYLEKLKIIKNINKPILIKQIIVSSTPFAFKKFCLEFSVGDWGMRKNAQIQCIFQECKHHKLKKVSHTWWNMQVTENSTSILERDKTLGSLKKYERMYP